MNPVLDELASAVLMYIDPSRLAVVDFTFNNCRVSTSFHLEARYPIVVDVVGFKVTLRMKTVQHILVTLYGVTLLMTIKKLHIDIV